MKSLSFLFLILYFIKKDPFSNLFCFETMCDNLFQEGTDTPRESGLGTIQPGTALSEVRTQYTNTLVSDFLIQSDIWYSFI